VKTEVEIIENGFIYGIFRNDPGKLPRQIQKLGKQMIYCNVKASECFQMCFLGEKAISLAEVTHVSFEFATL